MLVDAEGFAGLVVDEIQLGQLDDDRLAVAHIIGGLEAGANDLLGRDAVDTLGPGTHEVDPAARDDEGFESVRPQIVEQLEHGLINHVGVGFAGDGVFRGGEPIVHGVRKLFGGESGMGGRGHRE